MFLHIAKTQKMGHNLQEKPGRYLNLLTEITMTWALSKNQTCFTASTETFCVHLSKWAKPWNPPAVSWQPEVTDLQRADKGCTEVQVSPTPPPSTYPAQHRQTHMVSNTWFRLQTNVSCLTSTPSSAPNHNSSTGNSGGCYTIVRCLRHNTDIHFLELGPL